MIHFFRLPLCCLVLLLAACNAADKKATVSQQPSKLYLDYKVTADEGSENVVILLQFKKASADDKAIALESGSRVTLDGEIVAADSARQAGVYYEVQRPLQGFAGKHTIVFTDKEGNAYEQEFEFNPIILDGLPSVINRKELTLTLGAHKNEDRVQVLVTDTAFETADINEEYSVKDGRIVIQEEALEKVNNGPLAIEIYREQEEKLPNGRILITYVVKREVELRD